MASTIQIKRGTGSAVPSGLLDGELAINLDSGKLYYGSGSNSVNSYTVTNITASGDISSSGTITANKIVSTGTDIELTNVSSPQITIKDTTNNNTLVLEQDNTRSHIRFDDAASNDLHFDSNADNNHLVLDSGNGNSGFGTQVYNKTSKVTVSGDIFASGSNGHITASGNISASGTLVGGGLDINGTTTFNDGNITNVGIIDVDKIRGDGDNDVTIQLDSAGYSFNLGEKDKNFIYFDSDEDALIHGDAGLSRVGISDTSPSSKLDVGGDLNVQSHITASGNISSSGALISSVVSSSIYRGGIRPLDQSVQIRTGSLAQGDIYYAENGVTTVAGKIYALLGNGNQVVADKDTEIHSNSLLGVAIGTNSGTNGFLLRGMVKLHTNPFPAEAALGNPAYIGDSGLATGSIAGHASDDFIRIIGYCISGSGTVYFDPDKTFIKKA